MSEGTIHRRIARKSTVDGVGLRGEETAVERCGQACGSTGQPAEVWADRWKCCAGQPAEVLAALVLAAVESDEEDEDSEALDALDDSEPEDSEPEDSEPEDSEPEDSEPEDSEFDLCEEFDVEDTVFELLARESVA